MVWNLNANVTLLRQLWEYITKICQLTKFLTRVFHSESWCKTGNLIQCCKNYMTQSKGIFIAAIKIVFYKKYVQCFSEMHLFHQVLILIRYKFDLMSFYWLLLRSIQQFFTMFDQTCVSWDSKVVCNLNILKTYTWHQLILQYNLQIFFAFWDIYWYQQFV